MSVYRGDFLGFQLGDEHSYNLNITRVSSNDRYSEGLIPNFTNTAVQVPGGDETYYWDAQYNSKQIQVDFAFDELTDSDLRGLRQMFGYKGIKQFIMDEFPYKKYMVRPSAPPVISYICFEEEDGKVYKGEGNVTFVAYYPFALSVNPISIDYAAGGVTISNPGDLESNFSIVYALSNLTSGLTLALTSSGTTKTLTIGNITAKSGDTYLLLNSRTQLLEGLDSSQNRTGNLYNLHITGGDFFTIPPGTSTLVTSKTYVSAEYSPVYY